MHLKYIPIKEHISINIQGQFHFIHIHPVFNNTPAQVTTYIKEYLKRLDESIEKCKC